MMISHMILVLTVSRLNSICDRMNAIERGLPAPPVDIRSPESIDRAARRVFVSSAPTGVTIAILSPDCQGVDFHAEGLTVSGAYHAILEMVQECCEMMDADLCYLETGERYQEGSFGGPPAPGMGPNASN